MFFPQKSPRRDLRGLFQGSAFAASLRRSGGRKRRYTIIETMTFRLSAVTWDQTSPYIPTRWFSRYSMGILNPSQRTVPSSSEILPFPNAWNRYTVKKLMNISGVASTRARRNDDASRTVSASS